MEEPVEEDEPNQVVGDLWGKGLQVPEYPHLFLKFTSPTNC
jgi:hypothetical protein